MKEIVRLGDNPVKISTKQKSIIKSFFKKVKRGVIAHFKDGISFKDIIVMEKEYGAFEKKITDMEKKASDFAETFKTSIDKKALENEYKSLRKNANELYSSMKDLSNVSKDMEEELENRFKEIYSTLKDAEDEFKPQRVTNRQNSESKIELKEENGELKAFVNPGTSIKENVVPVEPEHIDLTAALKKSQDNEKVTAISHNDNEKAAQMERFATVVDRAAKKKAELERFATVVDRAAKKKAEETGKSEKLTKFALGDLTIFENYLAYKKAYLWNANLENLGKKLGTDNYKMVIDNYAESISPSKYKFRTMLSETAFTAKRDEQVKAKEIALKEAEHKKELEDKDIALKDALDAEIKKQENKINTLTNQRNDLKTNVRRQDSLFKAQAEALAKIEESCKLLGGIPAIDSAIEEAKKKCENINERYDAKKQAMKNLSNSQGDDELEKAAIAYAKAEAEKALKADGEKVEVSTNIFDTPSEETNEKDDELVSEINSTDFSSQAKDIKNDSPIGKFDDGNDYWVNQEAALNDRKDELTPEQFAERQKELYAYCSRHFVSAV